MRNLQELCNLVVTLESYKDVTSLQRDIEILQQETLTVIQKLVTNKELNPNEIALLDGGRGKINAIKAYRDRTNVSLVDAKNIVEKYMKDNYGGKYWNNYLNSCTGD